MATLLSDKNKEADKSDELKEFEALINSTKGEGLSEDNAAIADTFLELANLIEKEEKAITTPLTDEQIREKAESDAKLATLKLGKNQTAALLEENPGETKIKTTVYVPKPAVNPSAARNAKHAMITGVRPVTIPAAELFVKEKAAKEATGKVNDGYVPVKAVETVIQPSTSLHNGYGDFRDSNKVTLDNTLPAARAAGDYRPDFQKAEGQEPGSASWEIDKEARTACLESGKNPNDKEIFGAMSQKIVAELAKKNQMEK